jgi:hypothetical protein
MDEAAWRDSRQLPTWYLYLGMFTRVGKTPTYPVIHTGRVLPWRDERGTCALNHSDTSWSAIQNPRLPETFTKTAPFNNVLKTAVTLKPLVK